MPAPRATIDSQANNGVKAHGDGNTGEYGDKGEPLLKQTDGGGGDADDGEEYGDNCYAGFALEHLQHCSDQTVEGAAGNDDADRGVGDEHEEDNAAGIHEAVIDGAEHIKQTYGACFYGVVCTGHDHGLSGGLIDDPVKRAGGQDPGQECTNDNDQKQKCVDMGQP